MLGESSIKIRGGARVKGLVRCGGAKNLAPKVMIASIMCRSELTIYNVPEILDTASTIEMCKQIGVKCVLLDRKVVMDSRKLTSNKILENSFGSRLSHLFIGAMIHFLPEVSVPTPSGCHLGNRSIDFHLDVLRKFGLEVKLENGFLTVANRPQKRLNAAFIELPYPSVGATEMSIFLAVLAEGRSVISNIAIEPEISSLISFLQRCGAVIRYVGDRAISIEGVESLKGNDFFVFGDRLEASGWACLACASDGEIVVEGIQYENLSSFLGPFMLIGGGFRIVDSDNILFFREKKVLESIFLETGPFPMFSTDYQPLISILMSIADGSSIIHETLFDNRLTYLHNLCKFGARFTLDDHCYGNQCRFVNKNSNHSAIINGVKKLVAPAQPIEIDTIRSGFAYIMAAIIADGETELVNMANIMRGYSDLEEKLHQIGINLLPGSAKLKLAYA